MTHLLVVVVVASLTAMLLVLGLAGWTKVFAALTLLGSLIYITVKTVAARRRLDEIERLQKALEQLDQQSKLIIRTDFELHRVQEELDRRLASLMSLRQLDQQLQVSQRPDDVFSKLDPAVVTNFGFSKGLLGLSPSFERLDWRSLVGVEPPVADALKTHLLASGLLKQTLSDPTPRFLDATAATEPADRELLARLGVQTAVLAGVMPQTGPAGCLLLGHVKGRASATAETELVAILINQLAAAVENSALYEKTWTSQQELERKVRERTHELADANAKLQQLNKAKSNFVSAVSHELRTPLAAIKGYASLLATGQFGALKEPQQQRVAKIEKHADALAQLINNLLDIARIESGRVVMEKSRIPVEDLLTTVHDLVRPQLEAKGVAFSVDRDGVTHLLGDAQHLPRVFMNLLSNAVKYTPKGGTIRLGLTQREGAVQATVSDTGCGIAEEDLPKLFEEFYRSSDPINQQVPGTGLGLALVKQIVEAHQGEITVESEPGKGSAFSVRLPAEEPANSP